MGGAAPGKERRMTHVDSEGRARMVDVSHKPKVRRTASAFGRILLSPQTVLLIRENQIQKGDVLTVAKIAAIGGAKRTANLIPLCHNIEIDQVDLELTLTEGSVDIRSTAICTDKTGIEMEALMAVSIAALTIYDMCKAVDGSMRITEIHLAEKTKEESAE